MRKAWTVAAVFSLQDEVEQQSERLADPIGYVQSSRVKDWLIPLVMCRAAEWKTGWSHWLCAEQQSERLADPIGYVQSSRVKDWLIPLVMCRAAEWKTGRSVGYVQSSRVKDWLIPLVMCRAAEWKTGRSHWLWVEQLSGRLADSISWVEQ